MPTEQPENQGRALETNQTVRLAAKLGIPVLGARLLHRLGITNEGEAHDFLFPSLASLPSPWQMKGMQRAVELILRAYTDNAPITVFGDYDADGICATVLLVTFLKTLNITADWYIPDRLTEGYGLSLAAVTNLITAQKEKKAEHNKPGLVITVDNGITAVDEVRELQRNGFSVLITDHHTPGDQLPAAEAIINPRQPRCDFPCPDLAGVGVVFFLTMALRSALVRDKVWSKEQAPNLKQFLDLVALGTVADSMPLQGTNRILVRAGMEIMATTTRPGIQALLEQAGISRTTGSAHLSSEDIAFKLAPRINAAGRMGRADTAVHLLLANETKKARKAAAELELINAERKAKQDEITQQAESQYKNEAHRQKNMVVLYNRDWHIGVIGIVAARIAELCGLPVIVLADDPEQQGVVKGSGRGMPGTGSLYEEIKKCSDLLLGYGGHSQAIGLKLQKKNIKPLIEKLNTTPETNKIKTKEYRQNIIELDDIDDVVDEDFLSLLCLFEPFGMANPEPVFVCRAVKGVQAVILKDKHVRFAVSVKRARAYCEAIAFNQAQQYEALASKLVDIFFRVKKHSFRGQERVQLVVEKITISD